MGEGRVRVKWDEKTGGEVEKMDRPGKEYLVK
jgi:hypothetical protein